MFRQFKKTTIYLLGTILSFVIIYFLFVLCGLYISKKKNLTSNKDYKVYIAVGDIHVDFILPIQSKVIDWSNTVDKNDFTNMIFEPKYIQIGWGDRSFYLKMRHLRDLTVPVAVSAVLFPTPSLMHITYYRDLPKHYYELKPVWLSREQYVILRDYLLKGFKLKDGKPVLVPDEGYYSNNNYVDNFYEGNGKYHLFNTCNMWTAEGMYQAGMKTSIFTPFKYGVAKFID